MNEIRIVLDQENFRTLVRGQVVEAKSPSGQVVKIVLQDIGFDVIIDEVRKAIERTPR